MKSKPKKVPIVSSSLWRSFEFFLFSIAALRVQQGLPAELTAEEKKKKKSE